MSDPFNLARFVEAQEGSYDKVVQELRRGRKSSHWIWYIFPQVAGLGFTATSRRFGIASLDEARAYLEHPLLGPRLIECIELMLSHADLGAGQILGGMDAVKFRSSLTLFHLADDSRPLFGEALDRFFGGDPDSLTLDALKKPSQP